MGLKGKKVHSRLEKAATVTPAAEPKNEVIDDISRLDLRVGKVTFIQEHPMTGRLYINHILMGDYYLVSKEPRERVAIGPLRHHYKRKELTNKLVIVVCNLRNKVKFLSSQCFILFATDGEKREVLEPPPSSEPGDPVHVPGYIFERNKKHLRCYIKPKKEGERVFGIVAKDLKVNNEGHAEYRGIALSTVKEGFITTQTLRNCSIEK